MFRCVFLGGAGPNRKGKSPLPGEFGGPKSENVSNRHGDGKMTPKGGFLPKNRDFRRQGAFVAKFRVMKL
jgi:hypothetical protein